MNEASTLVAARWRGLPVVLPRSVARRFWARRSGRLGVWLALGLCLATLVGPWWWRVPPDKTNLAMKLAAPAPQHPLGTDQFGRDGLARVLSGGRRSLGAALLVLGSVLLLSLTVGIAAGMFGGVLELLILRLLDVLLAIPMLVLALAVVGVLGPGYGNLLLALVASTWAYYARLARSCVRLARQRPDVLTARLAGVSWWRIVTGHIVPGVVTQLGIVATLDLGSVIIGSAGLSFLGLGAQPPAAEWGAMLAEARLYFTLAPWLLWGPGAALLLAVVAANLIGNALREAADPAISGEAEW